MKLDGKQHLKKQGVIIVILLVIFTASTLTEAKGKSLPFDRRKGTIVIDPGHGGHYTGAIGPNGTPEKTVTLTLARLLTAKLEKTYHVALTRTDDYWLDISDRTATANHLKADLFMSLHVGGSFLHKAKGMVVFYCNDNQTPSMTLNTPLSSEESIGNEQTSWENIQNKHRLQSQALARTLQHRLVVHNADSQVRVQGEKLAVLEGADMPGVLIEIGYLANPTVEKKLLDPDYLTALAESISHGIKDFFKEYLKTDE